MTRRMMALTFRRGSWLVVLVAMIGVSACDLPPPEGAVEAPCKNSEATTLELGNPDLLSRRYAEFSTSGTVVWVTARGYSEGGLMETDRTRIELGWASEPPNYDPQSGATVNSLVDVSAQEGLWTPMELEAGDYWLWSSNGGEVTIQACTADAIFDPVPATFPSEPAG